MKLDIKLLIIIGLGITLIGFIMFGRTDNDYKAYENERKIMRHKIDSLEYINKKIDSEILILEDSYTKMELNYNLIEQRNKNLSIEIDKLSIDIENRKRDYNSSQKEIKRLNSKLSTMKENPPNREGEELIETLRDKFK